MFYYKFLFPSTKRENAFWAVPEDGCVGFRPSFFKNCISSKEASNSSHFFLPLAKWLSVIATLLELLCKSPFFNGLGLHKKKAHIWIKKKNHNMLYC